MNHMKYVVIDNGMYEQIFIFCDAIPHDSMVAKIGQSTKNVVSAGFVTYGSDGNLSCYGHSTSLNLKSRLIEDTDLLNLELRGRNPY